MKVLHLGVDTLGSEHLKLCKRQKILFFCMFYMEMIIILFLH
jgi:hypothetical protein